jgi:DNA polymerase
MDDSVRGELIEITRGLKAYLIYERDILGRAFLDKPEHLSSDPNILKSINPSFLAQSLDDVRAELGDCTRCKLSQSRTNIVFGEGDPGAKLMFIGEGPGYDEDIQGRPFVGRAGQLLAKIIEAIGLNRCQVYIANIVKCRPPNNRAPVEDEIGTCFPFLDKQIEVIRPKIIVTLGSVATQSLLDTKSPISRIRGKFHDYKGIRVMPTYHPAYLLRNPEMKRPLWEDMKMVIKLLNEEDVNE